jgi:hypothetical protein
VISFWRRSVWYGRTVLASKKYDHTVLAFLTLLGVAPCLSTVLARREPTGTGQAEALPPQLNLPMRRTAALLAKRASPMTWNFFRDQFEIAA